MLPTVHALSSSTSYLPSVMVGSDSHSDREVDALRAPKSTVPAKQVLGVD